MDELQNEAISEVDELFNNIVRFVNQAQTSDLKYKDYIKQFRGLSVQVKFGQTNLSKVPWMCFLKEGETIRRGYYPGLYYDKAYSVLYIVLGLSELNSPLRSWPREFADKYQTFTNLTEEHTVKRYPNSRVFSKYHIDTNTIEISLNSIKKEIISDIETLYSVYLSDIYTDPCSDCSLLNKKKQIILYGPPGTGKTFKTKEYAVSIISGGSK